MEKSWVESIKVRVAEMEGRKKEARDIVEDMIKSGKPELMKRAVDILLERGEEEKALEIVRKLRNLYPEDMVLIKKEIQILRELNELDEALRVVEEGLKINPNDVDLIRTKVEILIEQGEAKKASVFMEEIAKEIITENAELLRLRAIILVELGRKDEAIELLKRAIELEPEDISLKRYYIKIAEVEDTEGILEEDRKEGPVIKILKPRRTVVEKNYVVVRLRVMDNVAVEDVKINEKKIITYGRSSVTVVEKVDLTGRITPVTIEARDSAGNVERKKIFVIARKRGEPLNIICTATGDKGLILFDVSDPKNPKRLGDVNVVKGIYEVFVLGDYAYIASENCFAIIDISNFLNPEEVGKLDVKQVKDIHVVDDHAYITCSGGLGVIDVSDPVNPKMVGYMETEGEANEVYVLNNYAYVADGKNGLIVIDVSDPKNPRKVGHVDTVDSKGVVVSGNYAYVADGVSQDLVIVNVSNPDNPIVVNRVDCSSGFAGKVDVSGNYVFMTTEQALMIVDVSDPEDARVIGQISLDDPRGILVLGNNVYIAEKEGLKVVDITNPANPEVVTNVKGDTLYEICDAGKGLKIKNVSPNSPYCLNPENEAINVPVNVTLYWACNDPNGDKLVYDIYFGEESSPLIVKSNSTSTAYTPEKLNYNTTYYWKIVAKDGKGGVTEGPVWKFTTESEKAIEPPQIKWQRCLGGSYWDEAHSIQQTSDGGYIVAGYTESNDGDVVGYHGDWDIWVVKLDENGNIQWQKCLGGSDSDKAYSIQQTSDGGYIVAGLAYSNNGDVYGNHGESDMWIVKLDENGNL